MINNDFVEQYTHHNKQEWRIIIIRERLHWDGLVTLKKSMG